MVYYLQRDFTHIISCEPHDNSVCGSERVSELFQVTQQDGDINWGLLTLNPVPRQIKSIDVQPMYSLMYAWDKYVCRHLSEHCKDSYIILVCLHVEIPKVPEEKAQIQLSSPNSGFLLYASYELGSNFLWTDLLGLKHLYWSRWTVTPHLFF